MEILIVTQPVNDDDLWISLVIVVVMVIVVANDDNADLWTFDCTNEARPFAGTVLSMIIFVIFWLTLFQERSWIANKLKTLVLVPAFEEAWQF